MIDTLASLYFDHLGAWAISLSLLTPTPYQGCSLKGSWLLRLPTKERGE